MIDDAELQRVMDSYPCIWKEADAEPKMCFIGCPHLSLPQLQSWTARLEQALQQQGREKVAIPTVLTAAPAVVKEFKQTPDAARLQATGAVLASICPLMYMNNPLCGKLPIITNSNKLRTYTSARYATDERILAAITQGGVLQ